MPDIPEERTYKHQVTADFVLEAITTLKWSAEQTKKFNEKGIYRGTLEVLEKKAPELKSYFLLQNSKEHTLLLNIETYSDQSLEIKNIESPIPNLVFLYSKCSTIDIINCKLTDKNNDNYHYKNTNFFFIKSDIYLVWTSES